MIFYRSRSKFPGIHTSSTLVLGVQPVHVAKYATWFPFWVILLSFSFFPWPLWEHHGPLHMSRTIQPSRSVLPSQSAYRSLQSGLIGPISIDRVEKKSHVPFQIHIVSFCSVYLDVNQWAKVLHPACVWRVGVSACWKGNWPKKIVA